MTLRTLFAIPIAIILLVILCLTGLIAGQGWSDLVRGKDAVEVVMRMQLLLQLQNDLRVERIAANLALGKARPLPDAVARRLASGREFTDRHAAAIMAREPDRGVVAEPANGVPYGQYLFTTMATLHRARGMVDALLARDRPERAFPDLNAAMSLMFSTSEFLEPPLEQASVAVTEADPSLSGLVVMERLGVSIRDQVGVIAALVLPRYNAGERLTDAESERLRVLLGRTAYLTQLLDGMLGLAGATDDMRNALAELKRTDANDMARQLAGETPSGIGGAPLDDGFIPAQRVLVVWGERINVLRTAILEATDRRVTARQAAQERQFDIVMTGVGLVLIAIMESVVLLSQRVVGPIAQLGLAIARIASGDRGVALTLNPGTREIAEMATALETLRQAALVADAAALRQQLAARQRLSVLREAMGIARTVAEPARALERGVACLSEGIDATIALIGTSATPPPPTLDLAATAVRIGLADMRGSAADLEATLAAAGSDQAEDWPEAEFVAHILAVEAQVDRRHAAVRGFITPGLMALRDVASATGEPGLLDLVSHQFEQIETTVATVASMREAAARAASIVRDLPVEEPEMAA